MTIFHIIHRYSLKRHQCSFITIGGQKSTKLEFEWFFMSLLGLQVHLFTDVVAFIKYNSSSFALGSCKERNSYLRKLLAVCSANTIDKHRIFSGMRSITKVFCIKGNLLPRFNLRWWQCTSNVWANFLSKHHFSFHQCSLDTCCSILEKLLI